MFMACWALFNFAGAPSPLLVHQTANAVLWVGIWATYGDIGHGHGHVDADADGHLTTLRAISLAPLRVQSPQRHKAATP